MRHGCRRAEDCETFTATGMHGISVGMPACFRRVGFADDDLFAVQRSVTAGTRRGGRVSTRRRAGFRTRGRDRFGLGSRAWVCGSGRGTGRAGCATARFTHDALRAAATAARTRPCRDAGKIDRNRRATLTRIGRVSEACQSWLQRPSWDVSRRTKWFRAARLRRDQIQRRTAVQ